MLTTELIDVLASSVRRFAKVFKHSHRFLDHMVIKEEFAEVKKAVWEELLFREGYLAALEDIEHNSSSARYQFVALRCLYEALDNVHGGRHDDIVNSLTRFEENLSWAGE